MGGATGGPKRKVIRGGGGGHFGKVDGILIIVFVTPGHNVKKMKSTTIVAPNK